jgi:Cd2+/Zn2+-exporting ATPase
MSNQHKKHLHNHEHEGCSCHSQEHEHCSCNQESAFAPQEKSFHRYIPALISVLLLAAGLILDKIRPNFYTDWVRVVLYYFAYIIIAYPVIKSTLQGFMHKDFFNEFSLMTLATIGALAIGDYPEAVAVMLFYTIGDFFQENAVNKAKRNIKALLDIRPETTNVLRSGKWLIVSPKDVKIGETIRVKAGEKAALDGIILNPYSSFNTAALTGESRPRTIRQGGEVLAGMINIDYTADIQVTKEYSDSTLAKILDLTQNALNRKAKTELFIRKFARIYTPVVFGLALLITLLPILFVQNYVFADWLYRGLVFLVISCPCALVISVPLGYFSGIGAASHNGILFKGANFLELLTKVNYIGFDKTGTLTKGIFVVTSVESLDIEQNKFMAICAALEQNSNHPTAKAIVEFAANSGLNYSATEILEISGFGISGIVDNKKVLLGNKKLMKKYNIAYPKEIDDTIETSVIAAFNNVYAGCITIADELKTDAKSTISQLKGLNIKTILLSGDKLALVRQISDNLGIDENYGELLPQNKVEILEQLNSKPNSVVAFVGDGINDAPALAASSIGIAMGGLGSQAAIDVADVVIQTDEPSKIAAAIKIAKSTHNIVVQNIVLALSIKFIVLLFGAIGFASMWAAVFADVGVALLAILNSVRLIFKKF